MHDIADPQGGNSDTSLVVSLPSELVKSDGPLNILKRSNLVVITEGGDCESMDDDQRYDRILKLFATDKQGLADPSRVELVSVLGERPILVCAERVWRLFELNRVSILPPSVRELFDAISTHHFCNSILLKK